jgi:hypothetical protein|tara:strand:+ start:5457 stop:6221 length:765 start_codon:yes stop_codon:yes gene_type:complete
MSSYALFLFEGQKTEPNISRSLRKCVLDRDSMIIVESSFGFNIYKLFDAVAKDKFFDTYEYVVEQLQKKKVLTNEESTILEFDDARKFEQIYLFFDYDCHCTNAGDHKLEHMLELFNDSQDKGLLCVSYPMVEAIRHQRRDEPEYLTYSIKELAEYKKWVNAAPEMDKQFVNWGTYTLDTWRSITKQHLARANYLLRDSMEMPTEPLEVDVLFNCQLEKHISNGEVVVISGFPMMLLDHYGVSTYKKLEPELGD